MAEGKCFPCENCKDVKGLSRVERLRDSVEKRSKSLCSLCNGKGCFTIDRIFGTLYYNGRCDGHCGYNRESLRNKII